MVPSRFPPPKAWPLQRADSPRPRTGGSLIHDVFKPKLPLDPFVKLHTIREPWVLHLDSVAVATSEPRRDVLLILGAPTLEDISPVIYSSQFSSALIILASHKPLPIPTTACSAICLIRLNSPVTNERNDALRLAAILQCAELVSRIWRKNGGSGLRDIEEPDSGLNPSSVPADLFLAPNLHNAQSPLASFSDGLKNASASVRSSIISSVSFLAPSTPLPPPDPTQRAFDAILNFIPDGMSDLAIMKQSILVTTLSRPYLASTYLPFSSTPAPHKPTVATNRRSIFRRKMISPLSLTTSSTDSSTATSTSFPKAHLIHILPLAGSMYLSQEKLLRSMESFQLSFAHPPSLSMKRPGALDRAVAFIVPAAVLREVVQYLPPTQKTSQASSLYSHDSSSTPSSSLSRVARHVAIGEWTVADILLSGVLDTQANPGGLPHAGPRVWIGSGADFSFTPDIENESPSQSESVSLSSCSAEPLTPTSLIPGHGQVNGIVLWDAAQVYPGDSNMDESDIGKDGVVFPENVIEHPLLEHDKDHIPLSPSSSEVSELDAIQLTRQRIMDTLPEKGDDGGSVVLGKVPTWNELPYTDKALV
ncbi:hypothetical protein V8B97DRAFT_1874366 [Scleroderma yunnanense]